MQRHRARAGISPSQAAPCIIKAPVSAQHSPGRRTQVVKGEVCKTSIQRFESARRLHFFSARMAPDRLRSTLHSFFAL
jgi:hypothetical protein